MRATFIVVPALLSILLLIPATSHAFSYHRTQLSACAGRALDPDARGPAFSLTGDLQFLLTTVPGTFNLFDFRVLAIHADKYSPALNGYGLESLVSTFSISNDMSSANHALGFGVQADLGVSRVAREYEAWLETGDPVEYTQETRSDDKDFIHAMFGVHLVFALAERSDARVELAFGRAMDTICFQGRAFVDIALTEHLLLSVQGVVNEPKEDRSVVPTDLPTVQQPLEFHNNGSELYAFIFAGLGYRF